MILERGDMWSVFGTTDWFLITTNPIVNKAGLAVMGRGMAKQAADRFPALRADLASRIKSRKLAGNLCGAYTIGAYDGTKVGCFMVKDHWKEQARLSLISQSCQDLCEVIDSNAVVHDYPIRVDLNFPGIGNGGLAREAVLPIIERLPDNVHVWEYNK